MKQLKKAGKFLCSMKFALILLVILALACTVGSVIPQNETAVWYSEKYSRQAVGAIMLFGLDDIFHCWWFVALTAFLCLNLLFCSILRFPGLMRRMKDGFTPAKCAAAWDGRAVVETTSDPVPLFEALGFRKISKEAEFYYAVKNKAGIWGAWLCHLGMLVVILGFGLGQMLKSEYTVYGVPGQTKQIGDTGYELTIDDFEVKLREDATVDQYTAALTVTDPATGKSESGEASVNAPLSLFGMKLYQNSTGWAAALDICKDGEKLQEELLCAGEYASVKEREGLVIVLNAFYPDYAQDENGQPMTLTPALRNPACLYSIYYQDKLVGMNVLMADEKITVEEYEFIFHDPQQYTLIQIKRDPFGMVAAAGGLTVLCALILAFYVQPKELWAVKGADGCWHVAGKSRKAGVMFEEEIAAAWKRMESKPGQGERGEGTCGN